MALNFLDRTAATPTAAEGSMTIFILSQTSLMAAIISSSVTVITSEMLSLIIGQVMAPKLVFKPSATVLGGPEG